MVVEYDDVYSDNLSIVTLVHYSSTMKTYYKSYYKSYDSTLINIVMF